MIETNDKKSRRFDLPEVIFQVRVKNVQVISINMFVIVKNSLKIPWSLKSSKICNISDKIYVKLTKRGHKVIRGINNNRFFIN